MDIYELMEKRDSLYSRANGEIFRKIIPILTAIATVMELDINTTKWVDFSKENDDEYSISYSDATNDETDFLSTHFVFVNAEVVDKNDLDFTTEFLREYMVSFEDIMQPTVDEMTDPLVSDDEVIIH